MPTYEYICKACAHEFEEFQSIKADPIRVCPNCGKKKVDRKISMGGAVIFKGGGFYETDYRSESYKAGVRAGESAEKKPADDAAKASGEATPTSKDAARSSDKQSSPTREQKSDLTSHEPSRASPAPGNERKSPQDSTTAREAAQDSSRDSSRESSHAAAENSRIDARATHPSRVGRGIGNIVGKSPTPPATPTGAKPAKSALKSTAKQPTKKSGRK